MWNGPLLGYHKGTGYSIIRAIGHWYQNVSNSDEGVVFRDTCSGIHCSKVCPEMIVVETESKLEEWSVGARIAVSIAILLIAVVSLTMKVILLV